MVQIYFLVAMYSEQYPMYIHGDDAQWFKLAETRQTFFT